MERDIFDEWFSENIDEWITKTVEEAPSNEWYSESGDFFRSIGAVVDHVEEFLDDNDRRITLSSCYSLLGSLIEFALDNEWLEQEEQWAQIMDLFYTRSNEFIGDTQAIELPDTDIPNARLLKIVEYIVYNIDKQSELYSVDEFTIDEKIQMIRAVLIGLRTNRFIDNTPLLSRLFSCLSTDWRVMGGGFGGNMGSGSEPWSHT